MISTISVLVLLGFLLIISASKHPGLIVPLLAGMLLRVSAWLYGLDWELPFDGTDTRNFEAFTNQFGAWGWTGWFSLFPGISSFFFSWLMAGSGLLLGWSKANFLLLSLIPGVLLIRSSYLLGLELAEGGRTPATWSAWIVALHPTLIVFSASMLREAIVQWLLIGAALWLARYARGGAFFTLLIAAAFLVASVFIHAALILGVLPFAWILAGRLDSVRGAKALRNIVIVLVLTIFVALASDVSLPKIGNLSQILSLEGANSAISARAYQLSGGSAYPEWLVPDSAFGLAIRLPLLLAYFLFGPFAWSAVGVAQQLAAIEGVAYFFALALIFRLRKYAFRTKQGKAVTIFGGFLVLLFAASVFNHGTGVRHRAKFAAMIAVTACIAADGARRQRALRRARHADYRLAAVLGDQNAS